MDKITQLVNKIEALYEKDRDIRDQLDVLRRELKAAGCTHPDNYRSWWEWDSGYGVQCKRLRLTCKYCLEVRNLHEEYKNTSGTD